jgi:hypothetical protein
MMEGPMIKPDIKALGVEERVLLFCLASRTDWKQAGVTLKTVAGMWANAGNDPRPMHALIDMFTVLWF